MSNAFLSKSDLVSTPIQEGDAGIVLKSDGSFQVFSTGHIDRDNMTPEQIGQGEKLMALIIALKVPEVMDMLMEVAADPKVVGENVVDLGALN